MSLYLKYRPATLDKVKGNANIIDTLSKLLSNIEKCPHSFLLHGMTGCGKTTIGRIIANELGCKGNDFREIDSADFRGIDMVREIRKQSHYKAIEGNCIVWLIDECHKLTNDAQNALLKLLEEPPSHVYIILCTTEPQKLIETIKGRCSTFQVSPLSDPQMHGLIKRVVKGEGETLEEEVYEIIIRDSLGRPRNALVILEQVLQADIEKRMEIAQQVAVEQSQIVDLCRTLIKKAPWKVISRILKGLKDQDQESIRHSVLGYCQAILLNGADIPICGLIMETFSEPFYNTGYPGLVLACYTITKN